MNETEISLFDISDLDAPVCRDVLSINASVQRPGCRLMPCTIRMRFVSAPAING